MKALIHPGEFVYIYKETREGIPEIPFSALVLICYSSSIVVPEPLSHNGCAYISVRMHANEKIQYHYEYSDRRHNLITHQVSKLENKDREPVNTLSFIK